MDYKFRRTDMRQLMIFALILLATNSVLAIKVGVKQVISVRNGSDNVILDCRYEIQNDADAQGLVVKWFYDGKPYPVYQWVYEKKPQALGILKNKLDLSYKPSQNKFFESRALFLNNPTMELSGKYTCAVANYVEDKKIETELIVYTPASHFNITIDSVISDDSEEDLVEVECFADGLFPSPHMEIAVSSNQVKSLKTSNRLEPSSESDSFYVELSRTFKIYQRQSVDFTCILTIPSVDYSEERRITHVASTPTTISPEPSTHPIGSDSFNTSSNQLEEVTQNSSSEVDKEFHVQMDDINENKGSGTTTVFMAPISLLAHLGLTMLFVLVLK